MPELPEVETIRRQIAPVISGRRIDAVAVHDSRWCSPLSIPQFEDRLVGRRIEEVRRRGKYFVIDLDDQSALVLHLRMTGNLLYVPSTECARAHLRGSIDLDNGHRLDFVDPRRFGTAEILITRERLYEYLAKRLGPEPFSDDFSTEHLYEITRERTVAIKALLLDQHLVAGIGNIYADEALHRAGIRPQRSAGGLTRAECEILRDSIRIALLAGIESNGASIDDFRDAYGVKGSFQDQFMVHRRGGDPCPGCEAIVTKTRVAGRATYYCPNCQS